VTLGTRTKLTQKYLGAVKTTLYAGRSLNQPQSH